MIRAKQLFSRRPVAGVAGFVLVVWAAAAWAASAPVTPDMPLPERRGELNWTERQRVRYHNTTLTRKAVEAMTSGDYAAADRMLREALQHDPRNNHLRIYLIDTCLHLEKWVDGIVYCDELLVHYPDYCEGYWNKAFMAIKSDRNAAAIAALEAIMEKAPEDFKNKHQVPKQLALLYDKTGNPERAEFYGKVWLSRENTREARMFLAECAIRRSDWAGALAYMDQVLARLKDPQDRGDLQRKRAYALINLKRLPDADAALLEARQGRLTPEQRLEIERQLGFNAYNEKAYDRAAGHFKTCLMEAFDEKIAASYLDALVAGEQWDLARIESRTILRQKNLSNPFTEYGLGVAFQANQKLNDHVAAYLLAQQLHARFPKPRYRLDAALSADRMAQWEEAVRLYKLYLAEEFNPKIALDYHYLLKKHGVQVEESARVLEQVLKLAALEPAIKQAALYELAQVYRAQKRPDQYSQIMTALIKEKPEFQFYHEYAVQLYGAGHHAEAAAMFIKSLEGDPDAARKFQTCKTIADLFMLLKQPVEARTWLAKARDFGAPDFDWYLGMARIDYQEEKYKDCIDRLLPLTEQRDVTHLYLGYSFYKLNMPGLALFHLTKVLKSEQLTTEEQLNLYSNHAYLHFSQDQDEATLEDVARALNYQRSDELVMVRLKTLMRMQRYQDVIDEGRQMISGDVTADLAHQIETVLKNHPDPKFKQEILTMLKVSDPLLLAEVCQLIAMAYYYQGRAEDAHQYFELALEKNPELTEVYYLRGLCYFKAGDFHKAEADLSAFYDKAEKANSIPPRFWGDLGIIEGKRGDYDLGTAALGQSIALYPYDLDSIRESAYQHMKANNRKESFAAFKHAIDILDEITPYMTGSNRTEYVDNATAAKREGAKLSKDWTFQAYLSKTEFNEGADLNVPIQTMEGALPSQAGVILGYRPPYVGYRNERTLDILARLLANFEPNSWRLDEDSYQGGLGLMYKPFVRFNSNISVERLFKIGDNSEDNWLIRGIIGPFEYGEKALKGKNVWPYGKIFSEVDYYVEDPQRWVYYVDGRIGLGWRMPRKTVLIFPQALGIWRYQTDDTSHQGTYWMVGVGGNYRLVESEKKYVTERWYIDFYANYFWGWFEQAPLKKGEKQFEGFMIGCGFVK